MATQFDVPDDFPRVLGPFTMRFVKLQLPSLGRCARRDNEFKIRQQTCLQRAIMEFNHLLITWAYSLWCISFACVSLENNDNFKEMVNECP